MILLLICNILACIYLILSILVARYGETRWKTLISLTLGIPDNLLFTCKINLFLKVSGTIVRLIILVVLILHE